MLIIGSLLIYSYSGGQVIFERTYNDVYPSLKFPIELGDLSTVSFANNGECSLLGYRHIDAEGNVIREETIDYEAHSSLSTNWIGHDSVLIWYRMGPLDLGGNDSFKVKLWTPGNINTLLVDQAFQEFEPTHIYGAYLFSNQKLVYTKRDSFFLFNTLTSSIEKTIVIPSTSAVFEINTNILVISDQQPPTVLDQNLDTVYVWQQILSLPFGHQLQPVTIDSFLVGVDTSGPTMVSSINVFTEKIQTFDFQYFDSIEDMQQHKNILFLKGFVLDEYGVLKLNAHLNIITYTSLAYPYVNPYITFQYYPDRVYGSGYDGLTHYKANYMMSYQYHDAGPIKKLDIALDTVWIDSLHALANQSYLLYTSGVVHNFSEEEIHSLTIHYEDYSGFPFFCSSFVFAHHFTGLSIAPGTRDTLHFQTSDHLSHTFPLHRQYYVQHGNFHLDDDLSNNSAELTYLINGIEEVDSETWTVYPNPFTDFLGTVDGTSNTEMILYDQMGEMVSQGLDQLDDLSDLPIGIYFLQIHVGHNLFVKKVVKVD